jgi:hypothetical protein
MTGVLYLSPWRGAGVNVCPTAETAGCNVSCLNTAGRGGIAAGRATFAPHGVTLPDNAIQRARIARTLLFANDRGAFMLQLHAEIAALCRKAERRGLTPCVRLNGTSDLVWERVPMPSMFSAVTWPNIMACFPTLQFYDYTKLPARLGRTLPANYHLSISWSGADSGYQRRAEHWARETGAPLVVVSHTPYSADNGARFPLAGTRHVVDGDSTDLRFLDPAHALVILRAKGAAKRDRSGFVFAG